MFIYNIYYRFQIKVPVLLCLQGHLHTPTQLVTDQAEQTIIIKIYN